MSFDKQKLTVELILSLNSTDATQQSQITVTVFEVCISSIYLWSETPL